MKLLRTGKVKEVYDAGSKELRFRFTDNISVFDKVIPTAIPRKGESLARTSAFWFQKLEAAGICKTHFLGLPSPTEMRVRRVEVIPDHSKLNGDTTNYLIPLEVICRHYAAGSFNDRIKDGSIKPADVGLAAAPKPGDKLPEPFIEFTTKLETVDRNLDEREALEISGLSADELQQLKETVLKIDALVERHVTVRGLVHVDGKKEFGYDEERRLMIVDTFGTADEDRWWEAKALAEGRTIDVSKEFVRQYYRSTGYHEALYAARAAGQPEPPIPALPADVVAATSQLYGGLFERLTGQKF